MPVVIKRSELAAKDQGSPAPKPKKQSVGENTGNRNLLIVLVTVVVLAITAFAVFGSRGGGERTSTVGTQKDAKAGGDKAGSDALSGLAKKKGALGADDEK